MQLIINGQEKDAPDGCTIAQLLERYPPNHRAYAVEVNRQVIPRAAHETHQLHPGDRIEIVTLVGGG